MRFEVGKRRQTVKARTFFPYKQCLWRLHVNEENYFKSSASTGWAGQCLTPLPVLPIATKMPSKTDVVVGDLFPT